MYGAVEAGGTKFVCAIGDDSGHIHHEERFATADAQGTLGRATAFLLAGRKRFGRLHGIGVASFGPIELDRDSPRYGTIGRTPKPGWSGADVLGAFGADFACPIGFDTDVNGAALAEHRWGAGVGLSDLVYVTVGTGIGGGLIVGGKTVHGLMHPEIGHLYPRRHARDQEFPGVCPFHRDCLEGLASGPAIIARSGAALSGLPPDHPQWLMEADYLGQLCSQLVLTVSPRRLILGGGVMAQSALFPLIRTAMQSWLGGYIERKVVTGPADGFVVAPRLGAQAGVLGALALAIDSAA
jgi:fructokinase